MPDHDRRPDPMREIDQLLLEDLMMRRNFQPTKTAMALQTTCMLLVLLGVGVIFAYALRHPDVGAAATPQVRDSSGVASLSIPFP
jgi:hypothetical protein